MQFEKKHWGLAIVAGILLVGMVGCVAGMKTFFGEDRNPVSRLSVVTDSPANRLEINASIVAADPIRGVIKVELGFLPFGDLIAGEKRKLTRDILLHTNGVGKGDILLKKGHQVHPVEITLSLLDGDYGLYPIDKYTAILQIEAPAEPAGSAPLPLIINFESHNHQMHADAVLDPDSSINDVMLDLTLVRPITVIGFAWFMNAVILSMGLAAALVTYNVAYRGKKFESGLMIWMGALLFVMPGIRNMMPGTPPMGSFTDFLVFFWVEALLALCLCIMVLTWFSRAPQEK
nr:DUF4436 family protein [Rhodoferax sp.]